MNRQSQVAHIKHRLVQQDFPRLKMFLMVAITGGAGFLASVLLFYWGLNSMAGRYSLAVGVAYLTFLALLWLWLRTSAQDYNGVDIPTFNTGSNTKSTASLDYAEGESVDGSLTDLISEVGQADELAIPILAVAAALALFFSSLWLVYSAPMLFAELLADAALSASLYRHLRGIESTHWFATALRKTFIPFALTAMVVGLCGWGIQHYHPEVQKLGDFLRLIYSN